jgi:ATP-binding cassette subfamily F protein 3
MITFTNLTKRYGDQMLFQDINFVVNDRERVGVVGRNGCGKTTLFKLILGEIEPDAGSILVPRHYRIGCVQQHLRFTESTALLEGCTALEMGETSQQWKVEKMLAGLGFTRETMEQAPETLSGGYQIRLNLAKALIS